MIETLPLSVDKLIKECLVDLEKNPNHYLTPAQRIKICDAFGPSQPPFNWDERLALIKQNEFTFNLADRVRIYLSLLCVQHLLPMWYDALKKDDLLELDTEKTEERVLLYIRDKFSIYDVPTQDFVALISMVVRKILNNELSLYEGIKYSDAHYLLGNVFGYEQEEFPGIAFWIAFATYFLLRQSYGVLLYSDKQKDRLVEFHESNKEAPAGSAIKAYAGIFSKNNIWLGKIAPDKSLEFWRWWLTEAIPQAWELAQQSS